MANSKSFTLIELIIVIGIISIFAGVSLAYYNSQNETQKLKTDAQKFVDVFDLTRKRAMSSEKTEDCTLDNFSISFVSPSYTVTRNQTGDTCANLTQNYSVSPYSLTVSGTNPIVILPLNGILSGDTTITINNLNNKCIDINITSSGATVDTPRNCI
jgi:prepilin-type N-terminal cleavage/methylation domain-containing protein